jgi:hypothetical protein
MTRDGSITRAARARGCCPSGTSCCVPQRQLTFPDRLGRIEEGLAHILRGEIRSSLPRPATAYESADEPYKRGSLVPSQLRSPGQTVRVYRHEIRPALAKGAVAMDKIFGKAPGATCERPRASRKKGPSLTPERTTLTCGNWSGRPDSNRRPLDPQARIRCLGRSDGVGRGATSCRFVPRGRGESGAVRGYWLP